MKTLIVGGTSSLAQALKPVLSEFSEVVTAGRNGCDFTIDLASPAEKFQFPAGVDVVINVAASFPGKAPEDLRRAQDINVGGLLKLCEACTRCEIKHLIHVSSIFARLNKSSPMYGAYSLTKKQAEEAAELYSAQFDLPLTIIQPSQFYATGDSQRKHQALFYTIIDRVEKNEDVFIYGSHDALRNFIHVEDVAIIIAEVIKTNSTGKYMCVSPSNTTIKEIAGHAISSFQSTSKIMFLPNKPDIIDISFEDDGDLYSKIKYTPKISISDGMQREANFRRNKI